MLIKVFFCLIISYLRIKSYNVLNYNNYSTDWSFPLKVKLKRNGMDYNNIVTMTRDDDYENLSIDSDFENDAPFMVILGGQYSYTLKWKLEVPESFKFETAGITK